MKFISKLLILSFLLLDSFASSKESPEIVIIGAGLSGVTAAVKLIENGFENVKILEAENRIGGRIHSVPFANGMIDLGAQWVHGVTNNVVYDMVHEHFEFGDTGYDTTPPTLLQSNGLPVNKNHTETLMNIGHEILTSYNEMSEYRGSLGDFFKLKFDQALRELSDYDFDPELPDEMIDFFEKGVNAWNGSESWYDLSVKLNTRSGVNDGNQYNTWRDKGYFTVFDFVTKKLPNPNEAINIENRTMLNTKVVNIKFDPQTQGKVEITCENGMNLSADFVIFTGSLGVLKKNHETLFTPPLPRRKIRAIQLSGYGTLGKIFLEFDEPFWPTDMKDFVSYDFLWTKADTEKINGTEREWLLKIQSIARVDAMPNVLEALLAGKAMDEFETFSDEKVKEDCLWLLNKFLGRPVTNLMNIRRTKWKTNDNFHGSYSYQSLNAIREGIAPKDLAKPLFNEFKEPKILFAGEATDNLFASNAHGAIRTGHRVAQELMTFLDEQNKNQI